jgi:hypothetical protein
MKPAQRNGVHVLAYPFPALAMAGFFLAAQSRCSATGVISSTEVNTDKRAEFRGFEVIYELAGCEFQAAQKMPQIDQRVSHQLHTVMASLFERKAQQKPFEFLLPREGPLHAEP